MKSNPTSIDGQQGANDAVLAAATDPDLIREFPTVSKAMAETDQLQIVALAWRHQFASDRSKFKREIRELQVRVSPRIVAERAGE